jgi:hypothetical protein
MGMETMNVGDMMSFEKDGVIHTERVESVSYSSGSSAVYRRLNWWQSLLRRLTPPRWRPSLLVRPAELPSVTINGPKNSVGKTLEQIEAMRGMFDR